MDNPNPYNDDAFLEASIRFQERGPQLLDALWGAGASLDDIAKEIAAAFENVDDSALAGARVAVSVWSAK